MKASASPQPELLTMRDLMLMLGIKARQTVYNLLRTDPGFPRARRMPGGSLVWRIEEVRRWISSLPSAEFDGVSAVDRHSLREAGLSV